MLNEKNKKYISKIIKEEIRQILSERDEEGLEILQDKILDLADSIGYFKKMANESNTTKDYSKLVKKYSEFVEVYKLWKDLHISVTNYN